MPAIPHIGCSLLRNRLFPDSPHRKSALLLVKINYSQPGIATPTPDVFFRLTMSVSRVIPIKINVMVRLESKVAIPKQFGEIPVNQALHVLPTGFDAQIRNILRDFDLGV